MLQNAAASCIFTGIEKFLPLQQHRSTADSAVDCIYSEWVQYIILQNFLAIEFKSFLRMHVPTFFTYLPTFYVPTFYVPTFYVPTYLLRTYLFYVPTYLLRTYLPFTYLPTFYVPTFYVPTYLFTYLPTYLSASILKLMIKFFIQLYIFLLGLRMCRMCIHKKFGGKFKFGFV